MESLEAKVFSDLLTVYGNGTFTSENFRNAIGNGTAAVEYSHIIMALCKQLRILANINQDISEMRSPADANSFVMDVTSFLHEMECPYARLTSAPLTERLATPENRLLLVDFLVGELQAARVNYATYGPETSKPAQSPLAANLAKVCNILNVQVPADVDPGQLFHTLESKLQQYIASLPPGALPKPLITTPLNEQQYAQLEQFDEAMRSEYRLRREMLLKRFDVTIQSFSWSERAKAKEAELNHIWTSRRPHMPLDSNVTMGDILGATDDLLRVQKATSNSVRQHTQCPINRLVIGNVPDRGGRPSEAVVPPRDMPGFRARVDGGGGRGAHGGRGRGGGGRVQSGYGGGDGYHGGGHRGRTFHQTRGGYQQRY
ncbi:protein FAM98A-like [Paramacrobiotus metropolitanus]|uniref:protein FAM98A-like n=1 Tax=Paramacrobiotus metropolitanus TaxID=2943436 RepID=UPI00244612B1|nr:protein FAM98A-like [Paramacrobiotus metropolitanus]